jgi:hypothetical protein
VTYLQGNLIGRAELWAPPPAAALHAA